MDYPGMAAEIFAAGLFALAVFHAAFFCSFCFLRSLLDAQFIAYDADRSDDCAAWYMLLVVADMVSAAGGQTPAPVIVLRIADGAAGGEFFLDMGRIFSAAEIRDRL